MNQPIDDSVNFYQVGEHKDYPNSVMTTTGDGIKWVDLPKPDLSTIEALTKANQEWLNDTIAYLNLRKEVTAATILMENARKKVQDSKEYLEAIQREVIN